MTDRNATYDVIDLQHMGQRESVAAYLIRTRNGPVVVDPGPASTVPRLRAGLAEHGYAIGDLSALLLTHIHLDHAGASGVIARENPRVVVHVHELGAPHLVDPTRLLTSARRLYGDRMDELWGDVAPVPRERTRVLVGGENLVLGERELEVAYTPGHAAHHVSYYEAASGIAFVGDTGGLRTPSLPTVVPVTPPPEFDLQLWLDSLRRIGAWNPRELLLTHFGSSPDPVRHLRDLKAGLIDWAGYARQSLSVPGTDQDRQAWFIGEVTRWLKNRVPPALTRKYLEGAGAKASWKGMARYWVNSSPLVKAAPES